MNSTQFGKWLYLLVGTVIGASLCWVVIKITGTISTAKQIQKEITQNLATGKFGNPGKLDALQDSFPTIGGLSGEKIKKMIEDLAIDKKESSSMEDKK